MLTIDPKAIAKLWPLLADAMGTGSGADELRFVRLQTVGADTVVLTATNLEIGVRATAPATVEKPVDVLLPPSTIAQIMREVGEHPLRIEAVDEVLNGNLLQMIVIRGPGCKFNLPRRDPSTDESRRHLVQPIDPGPGSTVKFADLSHVLRVAAECASRREESDKFTTSGVLLDPVPEGVRTIGTDTKRLAVMTATGKTDATVTGSYLLPMKAAVLIGRCSAIADLDPSHEVRIQYGTSNCTFILGPITLSCQLLQGRCAPWRRIVEMSKPTITCQYEAGILQGFLRTVVAGSDVGDDRSDGGYACQLYFDEHKVRAEMQDPNGNLNGEVEGPFPTSYKGKPISLRINQKYLLSMVATVARTDPEAVLDIEMSDPNRAVVIRQGSAFVFLIMPMTTGGA